MTKSTHFSPLKSGFTTKIVAMIFLDLVVGLDNFSQRIVSNCDPIFLSALCRQMMKLGGTTLHYSIAYHPQSDGQNKGSQSMLGAIPPCIYL